ncbi:MAG: hypothetical protein U0P82_19600 [Vicinamibacterales bacterium]
MEYTHVGLTIAASVEFSGSFVLPSFDVPLQPVRAPFVMTGGFSYSGGRERLYGSGAATITLVPDAGLPGRWRVTDVLYELGGPLPTPWASRDVGAVGRAGLASNVRDAFVIAGDGADIWGTSDSFRFAHVPMLGSGSVVARLVAANAVPDPFALSLPDTNRFAKAGIMIRQGLPPSSAGVILDVKPDGGLEFMVRYAGGENTLFLAGAETSGHDVWLRLSRNSAHITAMYSVDGVSWQTLGSVNVPFVTTELVAGLAVTSHDPGALYGALFDQVNISGQQLTDNLLAEGDFEGYKPPSLGTPGWVSDDTLRQVSAKSETHQPHSGFKNGACWTTTYLDCGIYQELSAPASGTYAFSIYAGADRAGGLAGVNVDGSTANMVQIDPTDFGDYRRYTMTFTAAAGSTIRVWMYSPASPGYVVIDDASLTIGSGVRYVTSGTWTNGIPPVIPPLARFRLSGEGFEVSGRAEWGAVEPLQVCGGGCAPGSVVRLNSMFANAEPDPFAHLAPGAATVDGVVYNHVEFGGLVSMSGASMQVPTPDAADQLLRLSSPFTFSGTLRGVVNAHDPTDAFRLPLVGHGTATLTLRSEPDPQSGRLRLRYWGLTYEFE